MSSVNVSVNFQILKTNCHFIGIITVRNVFSGKKDASVEQIKVQFARVEQGFFNFFRNISCHFLLSRIGFHRKITGKVFYIANSNVHFCALFALL